MKQCKTLKCKGLLTENCLMKLLTSFNLPYLIPVRVRSLRPQWFCCYEKGLNFILCSLKAKVWSAISIKRKGEEFTFIPLFPENLVKK